jgi:hypothetical protein
MQVTLFHADDTPLEKGSQIELLGDGQVLATAEVDDGGAVTFDTQTTGIKQFAVRISNPQATPDDQNA